MDWAITLGLMVCILVGGSLSAAQVTGGFKKDTPEPFRSQQTMQVGFSWMLASIVPFWRAHPIVGSIALALGVVTFVQGCVRVYQFGKEQARNKRLAETAAQAAKDVALDADDPALTGKAASKRRRRAARKASIASAASVGPEDTPLHPEEQPPK